jgi:hypothetical protein
MDNVFPLYPVLERRRHKYNFRLHSESIAQNRSMSNKPHLSLSSRKKRRVCAYAQIPAFYVHRTGLSI